MSMFEEPKVERTTTTLRFSKQQKAVLQWMLEQEPLGMTLMEAEPEERTGYRPRLIPWSSRELLDRNPSNNQSSALSRTLTSLESRGLIQLHRGSGKKPRTTHVQFTSTGRFYAEALEQGLTIALTKETGPSWTPTDNDRKTMLELVIIVFRRELARVKEVLDLPEEKDYSRFDIPRLPSGNSKTRGDVFFYYHATQQALKTAEELNREGSRKFTQLIQGLVNAGLIKQQEDPTH